VTPNNAVKPGDLVYVKDPYGIGMCRFCLGPILWERKICLQSIDTIVTFVDSFILWNPNSEDGPENKN